MTAPLAPAIRTAPCRPRRLPEHDSTQAVKQIHEIVEGDRMVVSRASSRSSAAASSDLEQLEAALHGPARRVRATDRRRQEDLRQVAMEKPASQRNRQRRPGRPTTPRGGVRRTARRHLRHPRSRPRSPPTRELTSPPQQRVTRARSSPPSATTGPLGLSDARPSTASSATPPSPP